MARDLLARARSRGLSQRELAEELGLRHDTLGCWIRRERDGAGVRHEVSSLGASLTTRTGASVTLLYALL